MNRFSDSRRRPALPAAFIGACLMVPGIAGAHEPNATIGGQDNDSIGSNTWVRVSEGDVTADPNIMSYSGGWYDPVYHQLCIFGGGHWDYSGNEVWCFDIADQTWTEMYEPDIVVDQGGDYGPYHNHDNSQYPGALFNPDGESIENANPMSKHTYDQMEFVDGLGPIVWGGYGWGDGGQGWCVECNDTWAYNFSGADWLYLYDGSNPSPNTAAGVGASAYSPTDGLLYVQSRDDTWVYDPTTNQWNALSVSGDVPSYLHATMEYNPHDNVFYLMSGTTWNGGEVDNYELYRFDPDTNTWDNLNPDGAGPSSGDAKGPGLAFDTFNDVLLIFHGGEIWVYDPGANNWSQQSVSGEQPGSGGYSAYGRFRYDPVNNGAWFHGSAGGEHTTWFYRYDGDTPPAPAISMIVNPPTLALGEEITVRWAVSNADECTAGGRWSGSKASTGEETFDISDDSATFELTCTNTEGEASRSVSISDIGIGGGGSSSGGDDSDNPGGGGDGSDGDGNSIGSDGGGGALGAWPLLLVMLTRRLQRAGGRRHD